MFNQLGVIGCGLMGGSFALALKRAGLVQRVVGYSKSPSTVERARRLGVIDIAAESALLAVSGSDIVLIAVPVAASEATFKAIRHLVEPRKLFMDVGSAWSKVVGNWGKDDGIGLMTKLPNETDKWQIKINPKTYYNMASGEFPYWIACVFRDASGSKKGTTNPGPIDNGFVANNQDYFIKNTKTVSNQDLIDSDIIILPNPTTGSLKIKGFTGNMLSYSMSMVKNCCAI